MRGLNQGWLGSRGMGAALRLCVPPHYPPSLSRWGGGWLARDQHFSLQGPGDRAPSQALDCGCTNVSPGLEPWDRAEVDRGRGFSKGGPTPSPQLTLLPSFPAPIPPPVDSPHLPHHLLGWLVPCPCLAEGTTPGCSSLASGPPVSTGDV